MSELGCRIIKRETSMFESFKKYWRARQSRQSKPQSSPVSAASSLVPQTKDTLSIEPTPVGEFKRTPAVQLALHQRQDSTQQMNGDETYQASQQISIDAKAEKKPLSDKEYVDKFLYKMSAWPREFQTITPVSKRKLEPQNQFLAKINKPKFTLDRMLDLAEIMMKHKPSANHYEEAHMFNTAFTCFSYETSCFIQKKNPKAWRDAFHQVKQRIQTLASLEYPLASNGKVSLPDDRYHRIKRIMEHNTGSWGMLFATTSSKTFRSRFQPSDKVEVKRITFTDSDMIQGDESFISVNNTTFTQFR